MIVTSHTEPENLTAEEVAGVFRKSERTIKRWRLRGLFVGAFLAGGEYLFPRSCVDATLEAMKATPLRRGPRRADGKWQSPRRAWHEDLVARLDQDFFPGYRKRATRRKVARP